MSPLALYLHYAILVISAVGGFFGWRSHTKLKRIVVEFNGKDKDDRPDNHNGT